MVENKLMASDFSNIFRPFGPIRTPDKINPRIPGI
jgi:hypothetical protein